MESEAVSDWRTTWTRTRQLSLDGQHPTDRTLAVGAIGAVGECLATGLDEGPQPGTDVLKLRAHERAVAVVQHAATGCRGRTCGPAGRQRSRRIAPAQQALQPLRVEGEISGAA